MCGFSTRDGAHLKDHVSKVHKRNRCPRCSHTTGSEWALERHFEESHEKVKK